MTILDLPASLTEENVFDQKKKNSGYSTSTLAMTVVEKHILSHMYKKRLYFHPNVFLNGIHWLQLTNSQGHANSSVIIKNTVRVNYDIFESCQLPYSGDWLS
jgi:hypothetical protein